MSERTFTAAEMLQEADELDLASVASEAAAMLRQAATAEAALAEAQREIRQLHDKVTLGQLARYGDQQAITAERQKVQELEADVAKWRSCAIRAIPDHLRIGDEETEAAALDALEGRTPAQPPQDAEPAT